MGSGMLAAYDPQDFLGRLIGDAPWVRHAEKSRSIWCFDYNYFATDFHVKMFNDESAQRRVI
jgi:hypothetical protein